MVRRIPDIFSQLDFVSKMITRATSTKRPVDRHFVETRSNQSIVSEKTVEKSKQTIKIGSQPQTQKTSVIPNPTKNILKTLKKCPSLKLLKYHFQPNLL